jgi:hypothetical protein
MKSFSQPAIANFVAKFLSDNGSEELVDAWNSQENIEAFNIVAVKSTKRTSDKIKRGKSAYIFFCATMRPQVKEDLGEEGKSSIMAELGKRWKELKDDDDRAEELAKYTKMAADDKGRYEEEKLFGKSNETDEKPKVEEEEEEADDEKPMKAKAKVEKEEETDDDEKPKKQTKKKETGEKKPKTGYAYFCSYNREGVKTDNPEMKAQDITRELARMWKELTKNEQKVWSDSVAEL